MMKKKKHKKWEEKTVNEKCCKILNELNLKKKQKQKKTDTKNKFDF